MAMNLRYKLSKVPLWLYSISIVMIMHSTCTDAAFCRLNDNLEIVVGGAKCWSKESSGDACHGHIFASILILYLHPTSRSKNKIRPVFSMHWICLMLVLYSSCVCFVTYRNQRCYPSLPKTICTLVCAILL